MAPKQFTADALTALLAKRYAPPAWAFLTQVRNATGFSSVTRTADALAMSCWPSRGLDLHGFEIKVTRGDWLRELRAPGKADDICGHCDRWWIVASVGVVFKGELPPTWGLLETYRTGLKAVVEAPKLEAKPISRGFLAAILRNATETMVPQATIRDQIEAARQEWQKRGTGHHKFEQEVAERKYETLAKEVREFEVAAGISIRGYERGNVARAVRAVLGGERIDRQLVNLRELERQAQSIANHCRKVLKDSDAVA